MSSASICAAFLLAASAAVAEQPPFAREIEEIGRIAASEPPLLGIDTQIRAARVLAAPRRDESARLAEAGPKNEPRPPRKDQPEGTLFSPRSHELDGLSHDDILTLARKQQDPSAALDLIMHVMDDEPDARRRISLFSEALDLSARTGNLIDRLLAQSMLTRRLYEEGDLPRAAVGAQMLAENFERLYHCESAACDRFEGEDNPGEIIHSFAEYLREHKIPAERIGLSHPSLRVRILLLQIEAATARKDP